MGLGRDLGHPALAGTAAMHIQGKKQREREIVDLVYGFRRPYQLDDNEQPDFVARLAPDDAPFGIEVTEVFPSQSNARLDRIPGYVGELLEGGGFRHKADRRELKVDKIQILSEGSVKFNDVPAVIQGLPPIKECAAMVAESIRSKEEKLSDAFNRLRHVNLIVRERVGLIAHRTPGEFYRTYYTDALRNAVFASSFREIYFVLRLSVGEVFIPLKMVATIAQFFFFRAAIADPQLATRVDEDIDVLEHFGVYLETLAPGNVLVRGSGAETEVIHGDTGILLDRDLKLQVRVYSDVPVQSYGPIASVPPCTVDLEVAAAVRAFEQKNVFSSGIAFRVHSGDYAGG